MKIDMNDFNGEPDLRYSVRTFHGTESISPDVKFQPPNALVPPTASPNLSNSCSPSQLGPEFRPLPRGFHPHHSQSFSPSSGTEAEGSARDGSDARES